MKLIKKLKVIFLYLIKYEKKTINIFYLISKGKIVGYGITKEGVLRGAKKHQLCGHIKTRYISPSHMAYISSNYLCLH